jgi:hypothetical protein
MPTFPLRFSNEETHERLRLIADELGTSMNRLAEDMIERELAALSLGIEAELSETVRRLRRLRRADIEASLTAWAEAEGQADPISARMAVEDEDPFEIAAAFGR